MKRYVGIYGTSDPELKYDDIYEVVVEQDGKKTYPLPKCQDIVNHSPTGFCWGYGGSGPAQLSLAILVDHFNGNKLKAVAFYQLFKQDVVARLDMNKGFELTSADVEKAVQAIRENFPNVFRGDDD